MSAKKVKFVSKVIQQKQIKDGKRTTMQIHLSDKRNMTLSQIQKYAANLIREADEQNKEIKRYSIRGLNADKYLTLKSYDTNDYLDMEDYYNGRVKSVGKYDTFSQIQITIFN